MELSVPIVIKWQDGGSAKEETTQTRVVNAQGCLILLRTPVQQGQAVQLHNIAEKKAIKGHVVWSGGGGPDGRTQVGIDLEDPDPKFWGQQYVEFLLWVAVQPKGGSP